MVTYGDPGGADRSLADDTRGLSNLLWTIGRSRRAGVDCGLQYVEDLHNEVLEDFVVFGTAAVLREMRQTTAVYQQGEMNCLVPNTGDPTSESGVPPMVGSQRRGIPCAGHASARSVPTWLERIVATKYSVGTPAYTGVIVLSWAGVFHDARSIGGSKLAANAPTRLGSLRRCSDAPAAISGPSDLLACVSAEDRLAKHQPPSAD